MRFYLVHRQCEIYEYAFMFHGLFTGEKSFTSFYRSPILADNYQSLHMQYREWQHTANRRHYLFLIIANITNKDLFSRHADKYPMDMADNWK